ncbi:homoserine kinase [Geothrix sp. PMB-07]|uniref:homoserine kinase n=1 Tax=Geothrix sp. PMB-07 TaxID=3068640 RepID=UPI002741556D|nr:homoserine kinase [Geothrix sp. PMB-07]WLT32041.1 homoserine kinase [Geothrix sp. PMB-07]
MAGLSEEASKGLVAYAPASIGNVAAGFDLLGAALAPLDGTLLGDLVQVVPAEANSFTMTGPFASALADDSRPNLALRARDLFIEAVQAGGGEVGSFAITLEKRLPVASGLGSSASSIVATLVALQALCGDPLSGSDLLDLAGRAEGLTSGGRHLDNVAPSLLGGLQLLVPGREGAPATRRLPWPSELLLVVVHPEFWLSTAQSRGVLPERPGWSEAIDFAGNLASLVQALHSGDRALLARCLRDPIVEAHRAPLVPGFGTVKAAALGLGALGCSLSGSGPSVFAVAEDEAQAEALRDAMRAAFAKAGLESQGWVCALDPEGARVLTPGSRHPWREAHP